MYQYTQCEYGKRVQIMQNKRTYHFWQKENLAVL